MAESLAPNMEHEPFLYGMDRDTHSAVTHSNICMHSHLRELSDHVNVTNFLFENKRHSFVKFADNTISKYLH